MTNLSDALPTSLSPSSRGYIYYLRYYQESYLKGLYTATTPLYPFVKFFTNCTLSSVVEVSTQHAFIFLPLIVRALSCYTIPFAVNSANIE